MAAVTLYAGGTTSDTGATPNTSGNFTPAVGDLIVVCASFPGTTAPGAVTLTSSIGGNTFSRVVSASWPTTPANYGLIFVADQLIIAGEDIAQSVTISYTADEGTGSNLAILKVTGMTKVGTAAVRQSGSDNDRSSGATPTVPLSVGAALTTNPLIGATVVLLNPGAIGTPSGWTQRANISHASPNNALTADSIDSGFTGNTVTWSTTYGQVGCAVAIELDASSTSTGTAAPTSGLAQAVGQIPGLGRELQRAIGLGAAAIVGQIPGEQKILHQTGTAGLATIAGLAPTLATERAISPAVGSIGTVGQIPDEYRELNQAVGVGLALFGGQVPNVLSGVNGESAAGAGLLTLAGLAPGLEAELAQPVGVGAATIAGQAPGLGTELLQPVGTGPLTIEGLAPTLVGEAPAELDLPIEVGLLTVTGLVPIILTEDVRGHITARKRRSRYYGQIPEASDSHIATVVVEPPPVPAITVALADYQDGGVLTIDTTDAELELGRIETRRAAIARQRREEEELMAILMRAA
jgi:hypothetical protein